jgi:hypothetical protein
MILSARPATRCATAPLMAGCALVLLVLAWASPAQAGDARKSVKAKPGEIVVLRTVSTRHATRMQPPGVALLVDPKPNRELEAALGKGSELGDADIAALSATPVRRATQHLGSTLTQVLAAPPTANTRQVSRDGAAPGSNPASTVGQVTGSIAGTLQQAMGAIPVPSTQR